MEGVALDFLPMNLLSGDLLIIPHWLLISLLFVTLFYDKEETYYGVFYGVVFGLLFDIVYTGILGVYMFSYALGVFIVHELKKLAVLNFYVTTIFCVIALLIADVSISIIFSAIGTVDMLWEDYFFYRLIPTILANLLFFIILYPICRKKLVKWSREQLSDSTF